MVRSLPPVAFPTLGWQVVDWIEAYLCHGPGDVQGDDFILDDDEVLSLCWAYRVWPKGHPLQGRRIMRRWVYSRPKGRRKSELAGAVDCAEALGPVRCDGFDAAGEPVGVPLTYPFVRVLATEEEQAGNTYDNIEFMLTEGEAANAYALDVGLTRTFIKEPGGGEIVPSTSGSVSKDGGKESKVTADETHLYITRELKSMYRTVARNTGKRKLAEPWMMDTTTAWLPGERSIAEDAADKYMALDIEACLLEHGVLFDHQQGPEPKRFGDDRSVKKALRIAYGEASSWVDLDRQVQIVRDAEDPEEELYRYYLNIPRRGSANWLAPDEIKAVLCEDEPELKSQVALGFDGSENDDHTALWLATPDGLLVPVGIWTPAGEDLTWRTEVNDCVEWAFKHFKVVRFYSDPPYWRDELTKWAEKFSDRKRPSTLPVLEFWTNIDAKMAAAAGALRTAVRHKTIRINPTPLRTEPQLAQGRPLAVWHFENARKHKVRTKLEEGAEEAYTVRKERRGSPLKIDSVPSATLALRALEDGRAKGEFKKRKRRRASW